MSTINVTCADQVLTFTNMPVVASGDINADKIAFEYAVILSLAVISADKACAGGVDRRHNVEDKCICILRRRIARNHNSVKMVYACLHKKVRHGKYGVLHSRGYAYHKHSPAGACVKIFV